jgi:hypothetical protein
MNKCGSKLELSKNFHWKSPIPNLNKTSEQVRGLHGKVYLWFYEN